MKTSSIRKQRGALGLMMAMMMLVLVLFAALAIDMARLTYQQQALQSVADIAALEVARDNPYYIDGDMASIESELRGKYFAQGKIDDGDNGLKVVPGSAAIVDDYWTFFPNSTYSDERPYSAAQVKVEKTVPKSMIAGGALDDNTVKLTATAAIQKSGVVRLGIGSELISADLSIVDLSAVGYSGLVKSNIRLNDLIPFLPGIDLNALTPEEVLSTEISASDLLYAYADVLRLNPDEEGDISIFKSQLDDIADLVDGLSSIPNLTLGQLLELSSTQPFAALGANVNALDLVKATLYAANKVNSVSSPEIDINIPGVIGVGSILELVEAPQFKVGLLPIKEGDELSVSTEQVDLKLVAPLSESAISSLLGVISGIVKGLLGGVLGLDVTVGDVILNVDGAYAQAVLTGSDSDKVDVTVVRSLGLVTVEPIDINIKIQLLFITQNIGLQATVSVPVSVKQDQYFVNYIDMPDVNNMTNPFNLNPVIEVKVITGNAVTGAALLSPITSSLTGLLSPLLNSILIDTLDELGINIGKTTVWVDAAGTTQYGIIK